ncbi:FAD-dependent oxidoreductase [Streptomyces mirabilis]|uniref:FAD-dependent oxidoreductase n=1 Tax=Streptomyces mirabilis TaxID=68239 RepID=UPI0036DA7E53
MRVSGNKTSDGLRSRARPDRTPLFAGRGSGPGRVRRAHPGSSAGLWPTPWRDATVDSVGRADFVGTPNRRVRAGNRLVRGRTVLAGDAAHMPSPMTGRGFGTSLDDAAALAHHLRDADGNSAPGALADYEAERLAPAQGLVLSGQAFTPVVRTLSMSQIELGDPCGRPVV